MKAKKKCFCLAHTCCLVCSYCKGHGNGSDSDRMDGDRDGDGGGDGDGALYNGCFFVVFVLTLRF